MSDTVKKKIERLRGEIRECDYLYYVVSQPKISDKEYDDLLTELKKLEDAHPEYTSVDSPTQRVGGGVLEGFKTVRHRRKMLSLENVYSIGELREWDRRARKGLSGAEVEYVVEHKIDGVSANVAYEKGRLITGATRGDGETGEDVTQNIKTIRAVPLMLYGKEIPDFIEVRGEVYLEIDDFKTINKEKEKNGEPLFANPRNAASGSLKLLDSALVARRRLNFFAHSLGAHFGVRLSSQWEYLQRLRRWGVRTNPYARLCENLDEVIALCRKWQDTREGLAYEIDGLVVKLNSFAHHDRLGSTLKNPRWAVAYKFAARQATTEVVKIAVNVGRTGVITPTAELKPVECGGVVIRNATLHNFDEIKRLRIKEGDRVLIERAGDVIPKVVKVIEDRGRAAFPIPKACPVCSGRVVKEKEEDVAYRCINPLCPAQIERELLHFASRGAMDIEGLGEAVVSQLVSLKLVGNVADIYRVRAQDLLGLELFKEKKADNLIKGIGASKQQPLSRLIYALGIRHVGEKAAYVLARHFTAMDNLLAARYEDFDAIPEVGPVMARSLADYFTQKETRTLIKRLRKAGLNLKEEAAFMRQAGPFAGKTVVFTGGLREYSRAEAEDLVRRWGGNPSASVSAKTDFVVAGEDSGSKYEKARSLGVRILSEREFKEMVK